MEKLLGVLKSRKFWAALVAVIFAVIKGVNPDFPISEEMVLGIVLPLVAYILGVALEDGLRANAPK